MNKDVVYIYNGIYAMEHYSAVRKEILPSIATTWLDLEDTMLSEISQTERQIPYDTTYTWNLKNS